MPNMNSYDVYLVNESVAFSQNLCTYTGMHAYNIQHVLWTFYNITFIFFSIAIKLASSPSPCPRFTSFVCRFDPALSPSICTQQSSSCHSHSHKEMKWLQSTFLIQTVLLLQYKSIRFKPILTRLYSASANLHHAKISTESGLGFESGFPD